MLKWIKQKQEKQNNEPEHIQLAKANIYKQAGMAIMAVLVTLVLIFAMAVGWYSNVIHTEGLVFEAASWDFDFEGDVVIQNESQEIAPGESGIVSMELVNESDDAISVIANVTKNTGLSSEMKKRLYFYVEDSQVRNGEQMERVYINETDSYAYTVLGQNSLILSEEYHSDPYLKWEWVYDVLGYYVTGVMTDDKMEVVDYMRPVVYDYEEAIFNEEGKLLTVDGMTFDDYLEHLLETDGYQGTEVKDPVEGYYPVVVDETTNSGIWLYICDQDEIESATAWDTYVSQYDNPEEFMVRLLLSGQRKEASSMTANNAEELQELLNSSEVDKVVMSADLTLDNALTLAGNSEVMLDLNQNTLSMPKSGVGITVEEGSSLTIVNGTIEGDSSSATVITASGSDVILNNVAISGVKRAVEVADQNAATDSRVRITNATIDTSDVAVLIRGNKDASAAQTSVLIEQATIKSGYIALSGNGTYYGTDIQIVQSTLEGKWAGIYHPQEGSTLTITDSTITGYTAIALKAGTVKIVDTTVQGTGAKGTPAFSSSGFADTGDGIYIETNYEKDIVLDISGKNSYITSAHSEAIQVYEADSEYVTIVITGGKYSTDITAYVPDDYSHTFVDPYYEVAEAAATEN